MVLNAKVIEIYNKGSERTIELPSVFETPFRQNIIRKAFTNLASHAFQKQGRFPLAGEMVSAESRNTGLGIARIARARGEGFARAGQAAGVSGVRHGRASHPPESWKHIYKKINKKENKLALCSTIAATANKGIIETRGHKVKNIVNFPIVVSNDIESVSNSKDLLRVFISLGLEEELKRSKSSKKARTGKARRRGRRSKVATSALIAIGKDEGILRLSNSLPGIDIVKVNNLSVLDFTPQSRGVRLTIYSENAIKELSSLKTSLQILKEVESSNEQERK
jgi:large subunit ribosomal protein L4e